MKKIKTTHDSTTQYAWGLGGLGTPLPHKNFDSFVGCHFLRFAAKVCIAFLTWCYCKSFTLKKTYFGFILFGVNITMLGTWDIKYLLLEQGFLIWSQGVVWGGGGTQTMRKYKQNSVFMMNIFLEREIYNFHLIP